MCQAVCSDELKIFSRRILQIRTFEPVNWIKKNQWEEARNTARLEEKHWIYATKGSFGKLSEMTSLKIQCYM